ncbi:hypothetical protein LCGC14_2906320, partial [marine sediment metagenome]
AAGSGDPAGLANSPMPLFRMQQASVSGITASSTTSIIAAIALTDAGSKALGPLPAPLPLPAANPALRPGGEGVEVWGRNGPTPVLLARKVGAGRTLMLNLRIGHARVACTAGPPARALRKLFAGIVSWAGLPREAIVSAADGAWLMPRMFGSGPLRYVSLQTAEPKAAGGVKVKLSAPAWVYDVRSGKALGRLDGWQVDLDAWSPAIYALTAQPVKASEPPWRR